MESFRRRWGLRPLFCGLFPPILPLSDRPMVGLSGFIFRPDYAFQLNQNPGRGEEKKGRRGEKKTDRGRAANPKNGRTENPKTEEKQTRFFVKNSPVFSTDFAKNLPRLFSKIRFTFSEKSDQTFLKNPNKLSSIFTPNRHEFLPPIIITFCQKVR